MYVKLRRRAREAPVLTSMGYQSTIPRMVSNPALIAYVFISIIICLSMTTCHYDHLRD